MRISQDPLHPSLKNQIVKTLAQTLVDLKDVEEANIFLKDFFNESELETFAKRLSIAYWLKKGRSYTNIKQNLKVSSATIASVQSLMDRIGIKMALKKLEAEEWANVWAEKIRRFVKK
jgi:TrpR-related protein YerC/YecD